MDEMNIISLGAGVQSSTMALMAAKGEITPMPSCAIFADTQAEPKKVYDWLDWLEKQLPFPVYRVTAGSLTDGSLKLYKAKAGNIYLKHHIPAYTIEPELKEDGKQAYIYEVNYETMEKKRVLLFKRGIKQRQCTTEYKIIPLKRKVRELVGVRGHAIVWIGISLDEVIRIKPSRVKYIEHIWPLIDKRMTRLDCLNWIKRNGYPTPPRSACIYCPFHSKEEWGRLTREEIEQAADYEKRLQDVSKQATNMRATPYLHKSCKPLLEVDFSKTEPDLFQNECEGMCGV